ncbi:retroviral-like aspartic protease, partial [Tissierella creatinini]
MLEVRLATGAIVKTEKRMVRVRFTYEGQEFVETFIVLDLDDKFDIVLGMPWLARHDPVIDWEKRTLVRFGRDSGTVSDGPVAATHAPTDARDSPLETAPNAAVPERPGRARARAQEQQASASPPTAEGENVLISEIDTRFSANQEESPTSRGTDDAGESHASAVEADANLIGSILVNNKSQSDETPSTPGVDGLGEFDSSARGA